MNQFIKQAIEESFKSKKQQRLFYAKASDTSLPKKERSKWNKWSKEFSDKTDFDTLPEKVRKPKKKKKEFDEIVDADGNISRSSRPSDLSTKGITSKKTGDEVARSATGMMGSFGILGGAKGAGNTVKYWAENDQSKSLGFEDTMGNDEDYEDAEDHFEDELGIEPDETEERLEKMGYDKKLPKGKVRLIENPKKYIEDYLESILPKKTRENDVVEKDSEEKEINNLIIKRQLLSLKQTLKDNGISPKEILKYLNDNE